MKTFLFILLLSAFSATAKNYSVQSPDGRLVVDVNTGDRLTYSLSSDGETLVRDSEISMFLGDGTIYGGNATVRKAMRRNVDESFSTSFYKKSQVKNIYNELTLRFSGFSLVVRVYDDGAAYRFISHSKYPFVVKEEKASFSFADGSKAWIPYVSQHKETLESQLFNSFESAIMASWSETERILHGNSV